MDDINKFPEEIKNFLFSKIKENLIIFSGQNKTTELFENNFFCLDEDKKENKQFIKDLNKFLKEDSVTSIAIKNINLCNPEIINRGGDVKSLSIPLCEPIEFLLDIFNDFINYAARLAINESQQEKIIEEEFKNFEQDFFSDEITITFITNISNFYYHAGHIDNLIDVQDSNLKAKFLSLNNNKNRNIYFTLKNNFEFCFLKTLFNEIKNCPTIIEYTIKINKQENLNDLIDKAEDIFNKVFLAIRLICGGSIHFDFIRPFFIGNYTSNTPIIKEFPENHLYIYCENETTIKNGPFEVWINRVLKHLISKDYIKYVFVNQKIRDSYYRKFILNSKTPFSYKFETLKFVERLIDLIQGIENIMGGYGSTNRKALGKLLSKGEINKEKEIEELIKDLYEIRDKYIHGSNQVFSIIKKLYKNNDEFEKNIDRLEYILKQAIIFDILNEDFNDKIKEYTESLRPQYKKIAEASPINFPSFKSIYY